jgi:flagellar hook-basal body complex protein FliE
MISSISNVVSNAQQISSVGNTQESTSSFSNILSDALDNIKETEAEAQAANQALLTGESDDIHTALIAAQKANVAVSLAVEVRNRVVEAYNKITEMQV